MNIEYIKNCLELEQERMNEIKVEMHKDIDTDDMIHLSRLAGEASQLKGSIDRAKMIIYKYENKSK